MFCLTLCEHIQEPYITWKRYVSLFAVLSDASSSRQIQFIELSCAFLFPFPFPFPFLCLFHRHFPGALSHLIHVMKWKAIIFRNRFNLLFRIERNIYIVNSLLIFLWLNYAI